MYYRRRYFEKDMGWWFLISARSDYLMALKFSRSDHFAQTSLFRLLTVCGTSDVSVRDVFIRKKIKVLISSTNFFCPPYYLNIMKNVKSVKCSENVAAPPGVNHYITRWRDILPFIIIKMHFSMEKKIVQR